VDENRLRASSGWRETQALQAEMPGIVASELVSAPHFHLHARLRWLPAHSTTFTGSGTSGTRRIGNRFYTTEETSPTYNPIVLPIAREHLHDSVDKHPASSVHHSSQLSPSVSSCLSLSLNVHALLYTPGGTTRICVSRPVCLTLPRRNAADCRATTGSPVGTPPSPHR
jgi:hypothetical protein